MSTDTICIAAPAEEIGPNASADRHEHHELHDGWQALAVASLGRVLTAAEMAVVVRVPADLVLDVWFPDLDDAARHEALSVLGP